MSSTVAERGVAPSPRSLPAGARAKRERRRRRKKRLLLKREQRRRLRQVNDLLRVIASTGRRFFCHAGRIARLELTDRGVVWFIDHYDGARVYTHYDGQWKGFTAGGTMRSLIGQLRDYVKTGQKLYPYTFGPWPKWQCGGDLWGYGKAMRKVREAGAPLLRERGPAPPPLKTTHTRGD